jgi:hypothetical protein
MALGKFSSSCARTALAALALTLAACSSTSPPPRELAGHYELVGVMEMGSQLLLREQGTFEAVLYYGSTDINARGRWSMVDGQVELDVRPKPILPKETLGIATTDFTEPSAAAENHENYRLSSFSMSLDAMQTPLEVRWLFDDDSEQQTVWNASEIEDAVLPIRAGRTLKMLGIRAAGADDHFVWADVLPDERHFTVIRTLLQEGEPRAFFHKMRLTPSGNCLLVDMGSNTGCYRRR